MIDSNEKMAIQGQVIYFGASEKSLSDYISQYNNNCGLVYESSEDIASERSERRHFQRPHDDPYPANPHEYTHKHYLARNYDSLATFLPLIVWINLHSNLMVDSEHMCNVIERIRATGGQFKVIQGS